MDVKAGIQKRKNVETHRVTIPNGLFPVIVPEEIDNACHIKKTAQDEGSKELPLTEQISPSGTGEQAIDTEIQRVVTGYHSTALSRVAHLDNFIDSEKTKAQQAASSVRLLPREFNQEISSYIARNQIEYQQLKESLCTTRDEYERFRKENNLNRTANIRSPLEKGASISIALALIFVEALVNSSLFATNLEGGLIAGFTYASIASILNVMPAFLLGYFSIRNINHVSNKWKGYVGIVFLAFWIMLIAFSVAHFREALQSVEIELATRQALDSLTTSPFGLIEIQSWMLLAVTFGFALFAAIDGYHFDDPYPGFSAIEIKYLNIKGDWAFCLEERRTYFADLQQRFVKKISETVAFCDSNLVSIEKALQEKMGCLYAYDSALRSADKAYQTLVSLFRSENRKYRTTPAPKYFMDPIHLDLTQLPPVESRHTSESLESFRVEMCQLREEAENARGEIWNAFNEQAAKIQLEKEGQL